MNTVNTCSLLLSQCYMHLGLLAGLQNMQLSEYFVRGKSCCPGRFAPEKLQFLLGVGGEVVCTLLTWIADSYISIGLYRGKKTHLWLHFKVVI